MRLTILLLSSFLANAAIAAPSHQRDVSVAVDILRAGQPRAVTWRYSQHVDMNGDGERDEIFIAQDQQRFYVAVVLGPIRKMSVASVISFALEGNSQDTFCGVFESLAPESLVTRTELIEMSGDEPVGYPFETTATGLRLAAGECDSFHLFWNSADQTLSWWRL
jgi:hypothetical protein